MRVFRTFLILSSRRCGFALAALALLATPGLAAAQTDVVISPATPTARAGSWVVVNDSTAAGGRAIRHPNANLPKLGNALAAPVHYFEVSFTAVPNTAYRLWIHGKADSNHWSNDSVFVQFSGSISSQGAPTYRIGTKSAMAVNLEECSGCGVRGWMWQDNGYGAGVLGAPVYFARSGTQTLRVQTREDGMSIDQIVLSPANYLTAAPSGTLAVPPPSSGATTTTNEPSPSSAIRVAVNQAAASNRIESDFLGLSFEKYILPQGYFDTKNTVLVRLLENLGTGVIRLGGVTVDRTHWARDPAYTYPDSFGTIRPQDVDRYFAFAEAVNWRTAYGLNLASGLPSMSADEAAYVAQRGRSNLLAYELGNEPDIYPYTGMRTTYSFETFIQEFGALFDAVLARVPDAPVAGPVTAGTAWVPAFLAAKSSDIVYTGLHFYPAETATMDLLSRAHAAAASATLTEGANASRQYGKPFRLTETNSAWGAQTSPDLTNTFVNTLWGIDYFFSVAAHGYGGAWVHGGFDDCTHYAPMCRTSTGVYQPLPLYYALLAFRSVGSGRLAATSVDTSSNVTAYSILGDDGRLRVAIVNKDTEHDFTFQISPGATYTSATAQRLTAPSVTARSGITFAGSAVNADGTWAPAVFEPVPSSSNLFTITVPAASAAIVTFN